MMIAMLAEVQTRTVYRGKLFQVEVLTVRDSAGRTLEREVVRHPGAVVIVPVADDDHVLMIRNYRAAVGESLWELPAGKLEAGEEPRVAAGRELEEETGWRAREVRKIGEFYTSPGFANELMRAFVASGLEFVGQRLEAGEEIEVQRVRREDALELVETGAVRDGKTIAALLLWDRLDGRGKSGSAMDASK
jgi:ADP-ribose pyrophosphatase